ncbi:MAG: ribonuclease J [Erysipelotrichaceae bacterium]|nr:ribonuclease J [Erysipelotrichaceae bacterium]
MEKVRLMALGGLDEDGKNMYCVEIGDDIFVVDAGLKYPDNQQLGVEYVIPDYSYLIKNKDRVRAIFITHGHDDVMMAISHILKEADFEVYAAPLTAKIVEDEFPKNSKKRVKVIRRNAKLNIAGHIIHTFPVMMSIADGIGLIFETEQGSIVYTSEFIIDYDLSFDAFSMDLSTITKIGEHNVLCLLSESVGSSKPGYTSPKHRITDLIETYIENLEGRVIITLYKQNLYRIIEVLELARKYKRKVFFHNPDHLKLLKYVEDLGYYRIPANTIVTAKDFSNDLDNIICVVSGSGKKVFRKLNNICIGEDKILELKKNDLVIIASPVVPGTEKEASNMENDLYKADVKVVKLKKSELLSMHASKEDLKMMLYLVKPKYYLPVKGQYNDLINNADVAVEMGYTPDKIIILDNGQFATFENQKLTSTRDVIELEEMLIDGSDGADVSGLVLRDRETLSTDGSIVAGIVLDFKTKALIGGPDVQSRGVIYLKDAENLLNEIGNIMVDTVREEVEAGCYDNIKARMEAKEKIAAYVLKNTGKKPMILPAIVEVNMENSNG